MVSKFIDDNAFSVTILLALQTGGWTAKLTKRRLYHTCITTEQRTESNVKSKEQVYTLTDI